MANGTQPNQKKGSVTHKRLAMPQSAKPSTKEKIYSITAMMTLKLEERFYVIFSTTTISNSIPSSRLPTSL
jgi:hypothetical protein